MGMKCLTRAFVRTDQQPPHSKTAKEAPKEERIKLVDLLEESRHSLTKKDTQNLCFGTSLISLLHLANDNGFTLETAPPSGDNDAHATEFCTLNQVWVTKH